MTTNKTLAEKTRSTRRREGKMAEHDQSFSSEQEWINKASSWLRRHPLYGEFFKAICFDSAGMICKNGGDFAKATYPVYWIWPDQNLFNMVDSIHRKSNQPKAEGV